MKKSILLICVIVATLLLCSCEPLFTTYGEIVHTAVKEHYTSYEILGLIEVQKDGEPTLYDLCVIDDTRGGIDVLWLSASKNENNDYTMASAIIADNIEFGKGYSITNAKQDLIVEYLLCEKKDLPDSVLQKKKIKFDGQELYLCITNVINQTNN